MPAERTREYERLLSTTEKKILELERALAEVRRKLWNIGDLEEWEIEFVDKIHVEWKIK